MKFMKKMKNKHIATIVAGGVLLSIGGMAATKADAITTSIYQTDVKSSLSLYTPYAGIVSAKIVPKQGNPYNYTVDIVFKSVNYSLTEAQKEDLLMKVAQKLKLKMDEYSNKKIYDVKLSVIESNSAIGKTPKVLYTSYKNIKSLVDEYVALNEKNDIGAIETTYASLLKAQIVKTSVGYDLHVLFKSKTNMLNEAQRDELHTKVAEKVKLYMTEYTQKGIKNIRLQVVDKDAYKSIYTPIGTQGVTSPKTLFSGTKSISNIVSEHIINDESSAIGSIETSYAKLVDAKLVSRSDVPSEKILYLIFKSKTNMLTEAQREELTNVIAQKMKTLNARYNEKHAYNIQLQIYDKYSFDTIYTPTGALYQKTPQPIYKNGMSISGLIKNLEADERSAMGTIDNSYVKLIDAELRNKLGSPDEKELCLTFKSKTNALTEVQREELTTIIAQKMKTLNARYNERHVYNVRMEVYDRYSFDTVYTPTGALYQKTPQKMYGAVMSISSLIQNLDTNEKSTIGSIDTSYATLLYAKIEAMHGTEQIPTQNKLVLTFKSKSNILTELQKEELNTLVAEKMKALNSRYTGKLTYTVDINVVDKDSFSAIYTPTGVLNNKEPQTIYSEVFSISGMIEKYIDKNELLKYGQINTPYATLIKAELIPLEGSDDMKQLNLIAKSTESTLTELQKDAILKEIANKLSSQDYESKKVHNMQLTIVDNGSFNASYTLNGLTGETPMKTLYSSFEYVPYFIKENYSSDWFEKFGQLENLPTLEIMKVKGMSYSYGEETPTYNLQLMIKTTDDNYTIEQHNALMAEIAKKLKTTEYQYVNLVMINIVSKDSYNTVYTVDGIQGLSYPEIVASFSNTKPFFTGENDTEIAYPEYQIPHYTEF